MDMEKLVGMGSLTHVQLTRALGIYDRRAFIPRMFLSVVFLSTPTLVHSGHLRSFLVLVLVLVLVLALVVLVLLDCTAILASVLRRVNRH